MIGNKPRAMFALLLVALGLTLSSCVVYEPVPEGGWHDHHERWR